MFSKLETDKRIREESIMFCNVMCVQDGLWLVSKEPSIIQGYQKGILTPNLMEFGRLYEAMVREVFKFLDTQHVLIFP